eukprot:363553-Chlamydomonas_euryale.AAC.2
MDEHHLVSAVVTPAGATHAVMRPTAACVCVCGVVVPLKFKKPQQVGRMTRSSGALPGRALDPDLRLMNGALCNDCGLAAKDVEVVASGEASVTELVDGAMRARDAKSAELEAVRRGLAEVQADVRKQAQVHKEVRGAG